MTRANGAEAFHKQKKNDEFYALSLVKDQLETATRQLETGELTSSEKIKGG